ncbi:MAG: hypothetical protein ACRD92_01295 [Nitrosopumilaceae archaeon]
MKTITVQEIYGKVKVGTVAGLIGGFVILVSFFAIDLLMAAPSGTFYMVIGLAVGLHGMTAIIFGIIVHMLTAVTIGVLFCTCSTLHSALHLRSVWKGIFAGAVTGLEVYIIFFMSITLFLMIPIIDATIIDGSRSVVTAQERMAATMLKENFNLIMWGSFVLHVLFGSIMGLLSGIMLHKEYKFSKINSDV